jgi:tRNA1Val (adenine37-N6)-methyltransferase
MFRFKQFSVDDSLCGMKIGTDAVVLGAVAARYRAVSVLDIGTGCGIIALMIAQNSADIIYSIDVDQQACLQAKQNFARSPWPDKLKVVNESLQYFGRNFHPFSFDLIVCNPPYFINSTPSPNDLRNKARHNDSLSYIDIFQYASKLITDQGKLLMIFPASHQQMLDEYASQKSFFNSKNIFIHPAPGHLPKRIIAEYSKQKPTFLKSESLTIRTTRRHEFTSEYQRLTYAYHPFFPDQD